MAKVKGNLTFLLKQYVIKNKGDSVFKEIVSDIPEFQGVLISDENYPLETYQKLLKNTFDKLGQVEFEKINAYFAEKQLSGILGFAVQFISPQKIIDNAQNMWDRIYDEGTTEIIENNESLIRIKISNFRFTDIHALGTKAYLKKLAEITFKKEISITTVPIDKTTTIFAIDLR